jgi:beta-lactamase class A
MNERAMLDELGLSGSGFAAPVAAGEGVGFCADERVAPASVMKIQVGLTIENLLAAGELDGTEVRLLSRERRTPGPVGVSLMRDDVRMSVRDLVGAMLTISDTVAADELIELAGLRQINGLAARLGLAHTQIVSTLQAQLDAIARDAGFSDYRALAEHDPAKAGPPSEQEKRAAMGASAGLDPDRWTRTTAAEIVLLLRMIWNNTAGPAPACAAIRDAMARQLSRARIAAAFDASVKIAAKSGGLLGIVRNEAGVVTFPNGDAYAVAIFTRTRAEVHVESATIDSTIGVIARSLIDRLRSSDTAG